jgi:hypothetical protein
MERRRIEIVTLIAAAASFALLLAYLPILVVTGIESVALASTLLMTIVVIWLVSTVAAIEYSEDGWTVKGSTTEWILAAVLSPFGALFLHMTSKEHDEGDAIDPDDHERLRRL